MKNNKKLSPSLLRYIRYECDGFEEIVWAIYPDGRKISCRGIVIPSLDRIAEIFASKYHEIRIWKF